MDKNTHRAKPLTGGRRPFLRSLFVGLVLQCLLWQVQPVFACQVMDASGPAAACCCGGEAPAPAAEQDPCCDFSVDVSLKSAPDEFPPALLPAQPERTSAFMPAARYRHEGLRPNTAKRPYADQFIDPAGPGTDTYLATLRLRL